MSVFENKAAAIGGFVSGADATGARGTYRYAASTTPASAAVPSAWKGNFIRVLGTLADVQFMFTCKTANLAPPAAATAIVLDELAAIGTGDVNAGGTAVAGLPEHVIVPSDAEFVSWVSKSATGFVEFGIAEVKRLQKGV